MPNHNFVGITVVPVDVRLATDGEVEVTHQPAADTDPQYCCQVCWVPLTPQSIHELCPGPKVPDDLSSMPPVPDNPQF